MSTRTWNVIVCGTCGCPAGVCEDARHSPSGRPESGAACQHIPLTYMLGIRGASRNCAYPSLMDVRQLTEGAAAPTALDATSSIRASSSAVPSCSRSAAPARASTACSTHGRTKHVPMSRTGSTYQPLLRVRDGSRTKGTDHQHRRSTRRALAATYPYVTAAD